MLKSLHIRNYVLIDSLDIEFPEGLVIITGQTGAGKSILLGALSLLTGAKADASVIGGGADNCVVEAEFHVHDLEMKPLLAEADVEWCDGSLIVRRVIYSSGRSRSFVNDSPVSVQVLSDLASRLVDIHSQHQSLVLTSRAFQLSLLDHFAENDDLRFECGVVWSSLQSIRSRLAKEQEGLAKAQAEKDYNRAQFEQLDAAKISHGELERLEAEQKRLEHADQIKTALVQALALLDPAAGEASAGRGISSSMPAMEHEPQSLSSSLREASRTLEKIAQLVPSLPDMVSRLDSSRIELEDIADSLERLADGIVVSESRLEEVDQRISLIYQLLRKHSVATEWDLMKLHDYYKDSLTDVEDYENRITLMGYELKVATDHYERVCDQLHKRRVEAAPRLSALIQSDIRSLELDRATFSVALSDAKDSASGRDSVMYCFSAVGGPEADLAKCASGGEISRIMLCLKALMARFEGMPTMIFDEIDTGVSGSVAAKMGSMICRMGADMQVFAITHLPQVAARGEAHYVVEKQTDASDRVISTIRKVAGDERVMEIARLLSGETITPQAIANAKALLE